MNDHGIDIRDIQTCLNNCCCHQHINLTAYKLEHDLLQFMLFHLPMRKCNDCLWHKARYLIGDLLNVVDAIVHIINLSLSGQLTHDRLAYHLLIVLHNIRLDRLAFSRRFLQDAHVPDSHKAHVQRPRNRCRRQRQHIYILFDLFDLLLVAHAESLLLVDDQKSQILVLHICGQQSVCADDNVHQAFFQPLNRLFHLARSSKPRQHFHAHRKIFHALQKCIVVLLCQDRRRHEIRDLLAVLNSLECSAYSNLRFPIPYIAADQPVHDARALHVAFCRLDGQQLVSGLLKRKHLLKLLLPHCIFAKDKSLFLLPDGIQLHEIFCDLIDCSLYS